MKVALIILLLGIIFALNAELIPQHFPPAELNRGTETILQLNLTGQLDSIEEIIFNYREIGRQDYKELSKNQTEIGTQEVYFRLPRIYPPANGYEYFFTIRTVNETITLPEYQPHINPYRLFISTAAQSIGGFILLNPDTSITAEEDLVFALSFYNLEKVIDPSTIRVFKNGMDITRLATISAPLIVYTESRPRAGNFSFQVRGVTRDGKFIESPTWRYTVAAKPNFIDQIPFDVSGSAIFTSNLRNVSGENSSTSGSRGRNDAGLRLNLNARQDWFSFRSRLYLSSLESSSKQPVNRYSFGFSVPYLNLNLLDSTPNYGTYLLSNKNIRGVSADLHYNNLSLKTTYGQLTRAVDGKVVTESINTPGTFQRYTFASKLDIGSDNLLKFGLGFAKSKDRMDSLAEEYYLERHITETDTTMSILRKPKDNIVLGSDVRLALDNQRLVMGAEIATSMFNNNIIDGVMDLDEIEEYFDVELPFDPSSFHNIIIINKNVEPIIPNRGSMAYRLYLNWFIAGNFLNLSYSEVGASFRSLSSGFLQNDARIINLSDHVSLFNNQLILDAGVNFVRDNLSDQKLTTTTNTNWYLQSMLRLRNYPYLRMGYNTNTFADDLDSSEIDQTAGTFNVGAGYQFDNLPYSTAIIDLSMNISTNRDKTEMEIFDLNRNSLQLNINNVMREIPLTTRFSFINTVHKDDGLSGFDSRYYRSVSLRNQYALFEQRVRPFFNLRFNTFSGDQDSQLASFYELGTTYVPLPRTTLNTSVELSDYKNRDLSENDYSSLTWKLSISQRF